MDDPKPNCTEEEFREYAGAHGYHMEQHNTQTPLGNNLNVIDLFDEDGRHKWKWVALPGHVGLVSPATPDRNNVIPCVVDREKPE